MTSNFPFSFEKNYIGYLGAFDRLYNPKCYSLSNSLIYLFYFLKKIKKMGQVQYLLIYQKREVKKLAWKKTLGVSCCFRWKKEKENLIKN